MEGSLLLYNLKLS